MYDLIKPLKEFEKFVKKSSILASEKLFCDSGDDLKIQLPANPPSFWNKRLDSKKKQLMWRQVLKIDKSVLKTELLKLKRSNLPSVQQKSSKGFMATPGTERNDTDSSWRVPW